jgi:capsid assembly protease
MTLAELKAAYPDLHAAVDNEAYERGLAAGITQGRTEGAPIGAAAERERIQAVEAQALPGHDQLVAALKYDGVTTGPEAAVKILAAEKSIRETKLAALEASAPPVVATVDPGPVEAAAASAVEDDSLPLEERAKAAWDKDPKIRAEFGSQYGAYLAYRKAEESGRVKIYHGKGGN